MPAWHPVTPYICFSIVSTILVVQSVVLMALYRLAKTNPAFVLLFFSVN